MKEITRRRMRIVGALFIAIVFAVAGYLLLGYGDVREVEPTTTTALTISATERPRPDTGLVRPQETGVTTTTTPGEEIDLPG